MREQIPEFDETDIKTLICHLSEERAIKYAELVAMIGVITGIHIPGGNVLQLLTLEITKTVFNEKKYKGLSQEEFIHAFHMVANGDFGDIPDYGKSLNLKYFRTVMNEYISYKSSVMHKYWDWQDITSKKFIDYKKQGNHKIDYRPLTEQIFQQFLSGKYNIANWYWQCYDDLVDSGWVPAEAYKTFERRAKQLLIGGKNFEIMSNSKLIKQEGIDKLYIKQVERDSLPKQLGDHLQSVTELSMIHNGQSAELITARAKQLVIEEYFKQQAMRGVKNLFELVTDKNKQ